MELSPLKYQLMSNTTPGTILVILKPRQEFNEVMYPQIYEFMKAVKATRAADCAFYFESDESVKAIWDKIEPLTITGDFLTVFRVTDCASHVGSPFSFR